MNKLPPSAASLLEQARNRDRAHQVDLDATLSKLHATLPFTGVAPVSAPSAGQSVDVGGATGNAPPSLPPPTGVEALAGGALLSGKVVKVFLATVVLGGAMGGASLMRAPTREADSRQRERPALVAASPAQQVSEARSGHGQSISGQLAGPARAQPSVGDRAASRTRPPRAARVPTKVGDPSGTDALGAVSPAAVQSIAPLSAEPSEQPVARAPAAQQVMESELDLIDSALAKLRAGYGARALTLLQRHAELYPSGRFRTEREGLKVLALCESGRLAEGRGAQARFLREAGDAPIAAQVRLACVEAGVR